MRPYIHKNTRLTTEKIDSFGHRRQWHGHERMAVLSQIAHLHPHAGFLCPFQRRWKDALWAQAEYALQS